jgi:topoisomerase-4 subunit B
MKSWKTKLYPIVHLKDNDIEVAITHSDKSQTETYFSFVNGQNTTQGGTHLNAFREAYVKTIREFFNKNFDASDVRKSIVAAVSINVEEPVFESQTKTKLGSNDIGPNGPTVRTFIIDFLKSKLDNFLHKNPEVAEAIQKNFNLERERKELSGIQKLARERAKKFLFTIKSFATADSITTIRKTKEKEKPRSLLLREILHQDPSQNPEM